MEASEEIARQLRLRDLAGLIVIDFIDMEENRNNRSVERKLKDCLKHDRARIQVGRISHFGLMEMSRQRIRTGVLESSTEICPTCGGTGHMRSVSSVALHLLRALEEQLMKSAANDLIVRTRPDTALYLLNNKRAHLRDLEGRFGVQIMVQSDGSLSGQQYFVVEKGGVSRGVPDPAYVRAPMPEIVEEEDELDIADEEFADEEEAGAEPHADADPDADASSPSGDATGEESTDSNGRKRRRRGRRGGRGREREPRREGGNRDHAPRADAQPLADAPDAELAGEQAADGTDAHEQNHAQGADGQNGDKRRRRRGRRGGRRNRRDRFENGEQPAPQNDANGNAEFSGEFEEPDTTPQPEARPPLPENPGTAPQFGTEQPAFVPERQEDAQPSDTQKRRSTVREAPPMRSEPTQSSAPVYERSDPAPLAPDNGREPDGDATPPPNQPRKSGWWRR